MRATALSLLCVGAVQAYDNAAPHSRLPPMGWSSWVALGEGYDHPEFDFCDEATVKMSADAYAAVGLYDAGYRHFHLDDCWAGPRNATGYLTADPKHFPNGIKPVIDYVHSKGLTFGLYTCAGNKTCVGGRPGSRDHWEQDANVFAEWGVDYVKMDWCNTEGMDPVTTYPLMSNAMNNTGRAMHLNMCEWGLKAPWKWGDADAQSWRMSGDHHGIWSNTKRIISESASIPAENTGRVYGWNDMDMLQTGNYKQAAIPSSQAPNMTTEEYRTEYSIWAISASPLIVTTPIVECNNITKTCVPKITDLQKELLFNKEVIAINQDVTPQGRPVINGNTTHAAVWARNMTNGDVAVALLNVEDHAVNGTVPFAALGWSETAKVAMRHLWDKRDEGEFTGSFGPVTVPAHGTVLYRAVKH